MKERLEKRFEVVQEERRSLLMLRENLVRDAGVLQTQIHKVEQEIIAREGAAQELQALLALLKEETP